MKTSNNTIRPWNWGRALRAGLLCVPALALVACGGGGGGGGTTTGSTGGSTSTTPSAVVITTSNAQAVAAEAFVASTNTDAATAGSGFVVAAQVSGSSGPDPKLLASAARSLLGTAPGAGQLAAGVVTTQACPAGGTISVDVTSSGGAALTAGDSFKFVASNCTQAVDSTTKMVMNGTMTITIVSGTFDPASTAYPKSITMRIVTENFSIVAGTESKLFNGDLTMSLTEHSATSATITLSSTSLSSTVGSHSVTLTNYSLQETDTSTGSTLTVSGTVQTSNSRFASTPVTYTIATPTPLAVSSTGAITAGAIKVTGSGSALLLTVTATDTFSLQVDSNGDGTYDSTSTVTRTQLQSQV